MVNYFQPNHLSRCAGTHNKNYFGDICHGTV